MKKADLKAMLSKLTDQYVENGGEVVRYASPSKPNPIKLGAPPALPRGNEREQAWLDYIRQLEAGVYVPDKDEDYLEAQRRPARRPGVKRVQHGPQWRDEDFRGWKTKS